MTSPIAIRGIEQWSRWSTGQQQVLKSEESEGGSRMQGWNIRLLPLIKYGFILLALGLLLMDSFRLAFTPKASQEVSSRTQTVRSVRTVHGSAPARMSSLKRHSGV